MKLKKIHLAVVLLILISFTCGLTLGEKNALIALESLKGLSNLLPVGLGRSLKAARAPRKPLISASFGKPGTACKINMSIKARSIPKK